MLARVAAATASVAGFLVLSMGCGGTGAQRRDTPSNVPSSTVCSRPTSTDLIPAEAVLGLQMMLMIPAMVGPWG